jgi:hypothetical protein
MAYTTAELEASLNGFTEKINDLDAGKFIINALFGGDANSLNEFKFNKSFLENIKKTLEDSTKRAGAEVEKVSKEKLKQMVDPFGLSDPKTAKEIKDKVAAYKNKINQFLDISLPEQEKDKNAALQEVLRSSSRYSAEQYDLMRNAPIDQPINEDDPKKRFRKRTETEQEGYDLLKEFQKTIGIGGVEQKGFDQGETIVGSFSRNAKRDLLEVLQLDKMFEKLSSDIADKTDKKNKDKEKEKGSGIGDLLTNLLGGGIAAMFMGIVGFAGALMSDGPTKGFMAFIGKGGLKLGLSSMAKFFGGTFSKAVLKRMPIIGSLLSFALAYDYFKQGEYVDMALQIASGVANFVPGYGTALSVGIDVLQAVVDAKAGSGGTAEEKNSRKLDLLSNWGTGLYNTLKKTPLIGTLINVGEGIWEFFSSFASGDISKTKSGLKKMSEFPILGIWPALLGSVLDATELNSEGKINGFNWKKFSDDFSNNIKMTVLGWIPDIGNARSIVAKALGITLPEGETSADKINAKTVQASKDMREGNPVLKYTQESNKKAEEDYNQKKEAYEKHNNEFGKFGLALEEESGLKKQMEDAAAKLAEQQKGLKETPNEIYKYSEEELNKVQANYDELNNKINNFFTTDDKHEVSLEDLQSQQVDTLRLLQSYKLQKSEINNPTPVKDFMTGGSVTITNSSGQSVKTAPEDITYAAKDGGLIDKKLSKLDKTFSDKINKTNENLQMLITLFSQQNNNSVINISGGQQSKGYSSSSSALDHRIYHMKMEDSNRVAC